MITRAVHRVSIKTAKEKALPIILDGFQRRNRLRSSIEENRRNRFKVKRDALHNNRPQICPI